jgi:7-carboxy-7-deazaguanine synthase
LTVRITDIFQSIQGEGQFAGTPSVFVRTSGCNLRCWYCDAPYSSWRPEGPQTPWRRVLEQVLRRDRRHVVITGGEPLLQPDVVPLSAALKEHGKFITFETAGTVHRPVQADLMSVSPKLANSRPMNDPRWRARHERDQHRPDIVRRLLADYPSQLKFVIDQLADVDEVLRYLEQFPNVPPDQVWLMPQGVDRAGLAEKEAWLKPIAERLGVHYGPRRQIELYGNVRGT